jgi:hypothetical protein
VHVAHGRGATLRGAYYDARVAPARRRVRVRVAGGFGIGGVLRALYAMLLPRRGACLVRASVRPLDDGGAVLVADDAEDGVVALIDRGRGIDVEPTPFHGGTTPARAPARRVVGIDLGPAARRVDGAAHLLARAVAIDHSADTLERVLDLVTRLVASLSTDGDRGTAGVRR